MNRRSTSWGKNGIPVGLFRRHAVDRTARTTCTNQMTWRRGDEGWSNGRARAARGAREKGAGATRVGLSVGYGRSRGDSGQRAKVAKKRPTSCSAW